MVLVGIDTEDLTLVPLVDVVLNEIQIKGVAGFANRYPTALAMVASSKESLLYYLPLTELKFLYLMHFW